MLWVCFWVCFGMRGMFFDRFLGMFVGIFWVRVFVGQCWVCVFWDVLGYVCLWDDFGGMFLGMCCLVCFGYVLGMFLGYLGHCLLYLWDLDQYSLVLPDYRCFLETP